MFAGHGVEHPGVVGRLFVNTNTYLILFIFSVYLQTEFLKLDVFSSSVGQVRILCNWSYRRIYEYLKTLIHSYLIP
jgi:hypothetical protein